MTARMLRLVLAFLAGFILLSFVPRLGELAAWLDAPGATEQLGNALLFGALALLVPVAVIALGRRMGRAKAPARRAARWRRGEAGGDLARKLREASASGAGAADLARQFRISQDAVRVVLGGPATSPAAPKGSSFRSRQPALPAKPMARPVPARRKPYQALA